MDTATKPRRLDTLTALRAVAAFLVFVHHANANVIRNLGLAHIANQGIAGVSFFFVLSGFVLTWSNRPDDTPGFFYRRRVARIIPLYLLAWVGGLVFSAGGKTSSMATIPSLFLVQAWIPADRIHFAGNTVTWSLSCEMFFYLVFPLIIGRVRALRTRTVTSLLGVVIAVAIAVPIVLHPGAPTGIRYWLIYVFPPVRFLEFFAGVLIAVLIQRDALPRLPFVPVVALAAAVYVADGWAAFYLQPIAVFLIPCVLLVAAGAQRGLGGHRAARKTSVPVRLGEWSYAFYLFHLLVIRAVVKKLHATTLTQGIEYSLVCLVLAVIVAAVLCERVEKPLEKRLRGDRSLPVSLA